MSKTPQPEPGPDIPRVLLFGHRGAGKSALVGALLQAGETQGETLRGEVVHSSVDLPRIRDAVYSGTKLDPHTTELVSYTIRLRPWRVGTKPLGDPLTIILDDCDGRAAESLLEHPEPITEREPNGQVARAVVESDAIVLLVDASSTDAELQEAFEEFDKFLNIVHRAKTDAREVGGFPIFLVLTQCDRLARPGDTLGTWEERVQARVDSAGEKFQAHLKEADEADAEAPQPYLPFGSVDLTVFAAAVRRPPLPGSATPANHPYQVAELFRDCFAEARAHHERTRKSDTRLRWTVRLALSAVVFMVAGLATVALFPPHPTTPQLAERVRAYLTSEPPPAVRLSEGEIERTKSILTRFKTDTAYPDLEPDLKAFVESRIKEVEDYRAYLGALTNPPPSDTKQPLALPPDKARTLTALDNAIGALRHKLAPPPQYAWQDTPAAHLRDDWLDDAEAIKKAVAALVASYDGYEREAIGLMLKRPFGEGWLTEFDALTARGGRPPFPLDEPLPGSPEVRAPAPTWRRDRVTYRVPALFDEVDHKRGLWEQSRQRAAHMRDLADALGMNPAPGRPAPVLALPEPGTADPTTLAGERLAALNREYPQPSAGYQPWELWNFPPPARADLLARLQKSFETGARHVQKLMPPANSVDGWKSLGAALSGAKYRDWGRLLHLLARLQRARESDPVPADPVAELAKFLSDLDTKTFEINPTGFELTIPLDLTAGLDSLDPVGETLTVRVLHGNTTQVTKYTVKKGQLGTATIAGKEKQVMTYPLVAEGNTKLSYHAGDDLRAVLPVKAGARTLELRWESGASETFRFDRLTREPHLSNAIGGADPAAGVRLTPSNGDAIPRFPVLMPVK